VRQIRMLRAMWRELETGLRLLLTGHEGGNPRHSQGAAYESPRQFPTLPGTLFRPGLLILRCKLPAGLDPERRIRRQDTIGIDVLVREVHGIFGDDAANELEGYGIQREALDDVQFIAVRKVACQAAGLETNRVDDERVAVPAAD
jgi:hypothetical protein